MKRTVSQLESIAVLALGLIATANDSIVVSGELSYRVPGYFTTDGDADRDNQHP